MNWVIIGSSNGLSPVRRQAITRTNAGSLSIWLLGAYCSKLWFGFLSFSFKKVHLKMSSAKWRLFRFGLNGFILCPEQFNFRMFSNQSYPYGVMAEKRIPHCWRFVRGNHRRWADSPHKCPEFWCFLYCWLEEAVKQTMSKDIDVNSKVIAIRGPLCLNGLTSIPAWISHYTHYNAWDKITYPFPSFNCAAIEVWERISNFVSHFSMELMTYPYWIKLNPCQ